MDDALAGVLALAQTGQPLLCTCELTTPWGLAVDARTKMAVHVVLRGGGWLRRRGHEPVALSTGDVVMMARGEPHAIVDAPSTRARPYEEELAAMAARPSARAGESTTLLCAAYDFGSPASHPVLDRLPSALVVPAAEVASRESLRGIVSLLAGEAREHGVATELVVPRLVDCLLVLLVRGWLELEGAGSPALDHGGIERALRAIHEQPEEDWTVQRLARRAAMSRASFARHFAQRMGEPPIAYVARTRMALAAKMLTTTSDDLETIAARVGYASGAALGRAFRRHHGVSPRAYRGAERATSRR